jgi:hypothetical protein
MATNLAAGDPDAANEDSSVDQGVAKWCSDSGRRADRR